MRKNNAHTLTYLHIKIIYSPKSQLVSLTLHLDVHDMIYSAPVYSRLFHVSRLIAPVGKLANVAVHAEVELRAAECR